MRVVVLVVVGVFVAQTYLPTMRVVVMVVVGVVVAHTPNPVKVGSVVVVEEAQMRLLEPTLAWKQGQWAVVAHRGDKKGDGPTDRRKQHLIELRFANPNDIQFHEKTKNRYDNDNGHS